MPPPADAPADHNAIPCDGCIRCCKSDQIILRPEAGDDVNSYDWEYIDSDLYPGAKSPAVKRDPATGDCIYLTPTGCSIHERAPSICRRFHCARTFKALGEMSRSKRDALWAMGNVLEKDVVERGRDRLALARQMGLEHTVDTKLQVAAFETLLVRAQARRR